MAVSIWEGNKAQELIEAIRDTKKIDKQQGAANAGKALVVGKDGLVGFGILGIPEEVKIALLTCFRDVAWLGEQGTEDYEALKKALYPEVNLVKITANFDSMGETIYTSTPINNLKTYLTVTAFYNDGTEQLINNYAIIGTLQEGTCVLGVSYSEKMASFTVSVEAKGDWDSDYTWLYLQSRDGLMDINTDKFNANTPEGNIVEEINSEHLHVESAYNNGAENHRVYSLIPSTTVGGVLKFKIKFNKLPPTESGAGLRIKLSNGTEAAVLSFGHRLAENDYVITSYNGILQSVIQTIGLGTWHIVSLEFGGTTQKVTIDSNQYTLNYSSEFGANIGQIIFQNSSNDSQRQYDLDLDIAWITYKEM